MICETNRSLLHDEVLILSLDWHKVTIQEHFANIEIATVVMDYEI